MGIKKTEMPTMSIDKYKDMKVMNKKFVSIKEGVELYSIGSQTLKSLSDEAGAKEGKSVLMIDADPQGSLTISLGLREPDKLTDTLFDIFRLEAAGEEIPDGFGILQLQDNVDLIPSNINLAVTEISLVNVICRESLLRAYLESVKEG